MDVILIVGTVVPASAQTTAALGEPPAQTQPAKPMTPERVAWMKGRCAQLVAFFDDSGVSRGENSDGARNHTRIGASIECSRTNYRSGVGTMAVLLKHKAFDLPKPGTPVLEPEDDGHRTSPTRPSSATSAGRVRRRAAGGRLGVACLAEADLD